MSSTYSAFVLGQPTTAAPTGNEYVALATSANGTTKATVASLFGGAGNINFSQTTDLSGSGADTRLNILNTTLSPSVNTTNIWENFSSFVTLNGPGQSNGEINLFHANFTVNAGATSTQAETIETKLENFGAVNAFEGALHLAVNYVGGTVTGHLYGTKFQLDNRNASVGVIANYAAIDMEAMLGGGSTPTTYYLIRNADANASINSLGNIALGTLSPQSGNRLYVQGPDTSGSTFPIVVKNSTPSNIFLLADNGSATIGLSGGSSVFTVAGTAAVSGLITTGSAILIASSVALTNGAAAAAGTLTNAPAAGNPTKWIPINDNGTTRYLPAW